MKPTILTCAVTGTFPTRAHNPALPVTPAEIAEACVGAAKAGAAVFRNNSGGPNCIGCHQIGDEGRTTVGPLLRGGAPGAGWRPRPTGRRR